MRLLAAVQAYLYHTMMQLNHQWLKRYTDRQEAEYLSHWLLRYNFSTQNYRPSQAFITDKTIYVKIITLTPNKTILQAANTAMTTTEIPINKNGQQLSFHCRFLNFRENIGISDTINTQKATNRMTTTVNCVYIENEDAIQGMEGMNDAQNKPDAGTGNPKKEVVRRLSILNFANRKAENTGNRKANKGNPTGLVLLAE